MWRCVQAPAGSGCPAESSAEHAPSMTTSRPGPSASRSSSKTAGSELPTQAEPHVPADAVQPRHPPTSGAAADAADQPSFPRQRQVPAILSPTALFRLCRMMGISCACVCSLTAAHRRSGVPQRTSPRRRQSIPKRVPTPMLTAWMVQGRRHRSSRHPVHHSRQRLPLPMSRAAVGRALNRCRKQMTTSACHHIGGRCR